MSDADAARQRSQVRLKRNDRYDLQRQVVL